MAVSEKDTLITRFCNMRASFTLEASLIFSLVFLLSAALVYIFILMYQHAALQSVTCQAANRGAQYYVKQFDSSNKWSDEAGLYWRIFDGEGDIKRNHIAEHALNMSNPSIIKSEADATISISYIYLMKQLKVEHEKKYLLPVGDLLDIFGIPSKLSLLSVVTCPLEDNAEFIRNMDMIADIKNCLVNNDNKWIGSSKKMDEAIDNLVKNIERPVEIHESFKNN
ncbi:hypothetical protein CLHUN_00930 [Ruminiclostridium hungatei]|uniref:TadE-like protein n=1 Tax=Ruminiclostridium hungatei TaxID=48256 RepID=A0A1V4SSQ7_RUMHU|nr:hypothetical protein [Ruminiclostridium hungatei]OPX46277.1 hypothetical protein CLHUN_00930 [Ruminiclostridium hungatei]